MSGSEPGAEGTSSRRLRLSWGGATHQGQVRPVNQDALFADRGLFVVADGMGGHQAGEVASRITVKTLAGREHASIDELVSSVVAANVAVWEHASSSEDLKGMGTTLTALAVVGDGRPPLLGLVNVGDSRVYRLRGGELEQLTDDHSYVAELVRRGQISEVEAETHPYRNMLTRAIGVGDAIDVDRWEIVPEAGDVFLLCSDGLINEVEEDAIVDVLVHEDDPTRAARELIDLANRAGGRDNITVVLVAVEVEDVVPPGAAGNIDPSSPMETGVISSIASTAPDTAEMEGLVDEVAALTDVGEDAETSGEAEEDETALDEMALDVTGLDVPDDDDSDDVGEGVASPAFASATSVIDPSEVAAAIAAGTLVGAEATEVTEPVHVAGDADVTEPFDVNDLAGATEPIDVPDIDDPSVEPTDTAGPASLPVEEDDSEVVRPPAHPGDALAEFDLPQLEGEEASLPWLKPPPVEPGDVDAAVAADDQADVAAESDPAESDPAESDPADEPEAAADAAATAEVVPEPVTERPTDSRDEEPPPEPAVAASGAGDTQPFSPFLDPITASGPVDHFAPAVRGWKAPVAVTWRSLLFVTVVIAVIVAAGGLVAWYARSAYYVGYAGDEVVIYQGRPDGVLWFDPTLEESTGIFRQDLSDAVAAEVEALFETATLGGARSFVEEIRPTDTSAEGDEPVADNAAGDPVGATTSSVP